MTLRDILQDRWLPWILLGGLLLRCAAVPILHQFGYTSDEREYLLLAQRINGLEGFIDSNGTTSVRAPLYPFLLAGLLTIDGGRLALPHLLGVLLGAVVVLQTYVLAILLVGDRSTARWGAGIAAATPGLVSYSALLQTEALAIPLFLGWLIVGIRLRESDLWGRTALIGLLAGCTTLTRAVFLPFAGAYGAAMLWRWGPTRRRAWGGLIVAAAAFLLVLLPWGIRNYHLHGAAVPVSTFGGTSFLLGNNPYTDGTTELRAGFEEWFSEQVDRRKGVLPEDLTEVERSEVSGEIAWAFLRGHPRRAAYLFARKAQVMLVYPVATTSTVLPVQLLTVGSEFVIALLAALGIAVAPRPRGWIWGVCGTILFFVMVHIILHAEARYRLPAAPLIALCAAAGAVALPPLLRGSRRLRGWELRRAVTLVGAVLALYGVTAWMFVTGTIT